MFVCLKLGNMRTNMGLSAGIDAHMIPTLPSTDVAMYTGTPSPIIYMSAIGRHRKVFDETYMWYHSYLEVKLWGNGDEQNQRQQHYINISPSCKKRSHKGQFKWTTHINPNPNANTKPARWRFGNCRSQTHLMGITNKYTSLTLFIIGALTFAAKELMQVGFFIELSQKACTGIHWQMTTMVKMTAQVMT